MSDDLTLYTLTLGTPGRPGEEQAEMAFGLDAARKRASEILAEEVSVAMDAACERETDKDHPAAADLIAHSEALDGLALAAKRLPEEGVYFPFPDGERRLRVAPVAAADEGALLYESDCEESLWALARAAGIDFEEQRCDPLALLWTLRDQHLPD